MTTANISFTIVVDVDCIMNFDNEREVDAHVEKLEGMIRQYVQGRMAPIALVERMARNMDVHAERFGNIQIHEHA